MVRTGVKYFRNWFWWLAWIANKINWRFGRAFECRLEDVRQVEALLKPGMIILSRKKYEFTNLFIPGYWKHCAIVAAPGQIIDTTGGGVALKPVHDFLLTLDDFAILRPTFCDDLVMAQAGRYARDRAGALYSYTFNNLGEEYYCSGLVYAAYLDSAPRAIAANGFSVTTRDFLEGKIIKPADFYHSQPTWEVVVAKS